MKKIVQFSSNFGSDPPEWMEPLNLSALVKWSIDPTECPYDFPCPVLDPREKIIEKLDGIKVKFEKGLFKFRRVILDFLITRNPSFNNERL